jgi:hypothetical protein
MSSMAVENIPSVETQLEDMRNATLLSGLGAFMIGSEVSPRLMVGGAIVLGVSLATEGLRRFVHNADSPSTDV